MENWWRLLKEQKVFHLLLHIAFLSAGLLWGNYLYLMHVEHCHRESGSFRQALPWTQMFTALQGITLAHKF